MSLTAGHLVGREEESAAVVRLLDAPEQLPRVVLLSGEAGIGKTTLWLSGIDAAAERGYRIMSCRPSEAETRFAFAGLADLLGDAAGEVLPELPSIQRRALEAALLLGESDRQADEHAVAAAFLGALRVLARKCPVCLAVDDIQWLDMASLAGLRFALARLEREQLMTLLAVRGGTPAWLGRAVPEGRLRTIEICGLSVGALRELLRARLDASFPRPTLIRLWQTSAGNPFFALELASALQRRGGSLALGEELPIPSDLDALLHARLDGLSSAALAVARAVAALADPTAPLVERAVGPDSDVGLMEALKARILEVDGERVRFTHPLLVSAVLARQPPSRRRSLHARLATLVPTAEERARHLALATIEPSRQAAAILEDAAHAAHARGAPAAAAELAEQALRLTPDADVHDARRRLFFAADRHDAAGDTGRAVALLERARTSAAPGVERASVLARLAYIQSIPPDAVALYLAALSEAEGDDRLQADIHMNLASYMPFIEGVERGLEHAELAVRAAKRVGDPVLRCGAVAAYGRLYFATGRGIPTAQMEAAVSLERSLAEWPLPDGPTRVFGHQLWWSADVDRARAIFQEMQRVVSARDEPLLDVRWFLSYIEWRAGNWELAARYAAECVEADSQLGRHDPAADLPAAIIAAHRGQVDEARARAAAAIRRALAEANRNAQAGYGWVLGFIELSLGNVAAALEHLRRTHEQRKAMAFGEPGQRLDLGDLLEALIAVGELDEAREVLATWEPRAAALDRAWALAILARGRALLLAAQGDFADAFASFDRALAEHARSGTDPFHHARTLLALGRTQRRAKQRALARVTLEDALARFERLGAPLWAEQTRAELARIGGRAPSHGELTEAERRIAHLAGEGKTNREIAAALFLTEHSVETALTRVYQKLAVRSRAELAHRLATTS